MIITITAPRRFAGTESPTMARMVAFETPANAPQPARASISPSTLSETAEAHVPTINARIGGHQDRTAVEAVNKGRDQQSDDSRHHGIRRNQHAELCRRDRKYAHELWPQRHHEHEIHDVGELHRHQQDQ